MRRLVPRTLRPLYIALTLKAALAAGACGGGSPAADETPSSVDAAAGPVVEEPAPPLPDAEDAVETVEVPTPARRPVPVAGFEALVARLPDLPGWSKTGERGERLSVPVTYARAEADYRRNNSRIDLEFVDTGRSELLLAPLAVFLASGFSEQWSGGLRRATRIGGDPGFEAWNADARQGEVTRVVRDRYVVRAFGYDLADLEPLRTVAAAVSTSGLP